MLTERPQPSFVSFLTLSCTEAGLARVQMFDETCLRFEPSLLQDTPAAILDVQLAFPISPCATVRGLQTQGPLVLGGPTRGHV
jgi:hypothetical protein